MEQNYEEILKQNRAKLIQLKDVSPQYIKQYDQDGFLQHTQINPENGLNINRIEFNANINIDVFYAFVSDSRRTSEFDSTYQGKLLKQISEDVAIFYAYGKSPIFILDARDLVFLRENIILEDGTILVQNKSIEFPDCPPIKGIERADMLFQGWFIKKTGPNSINAINIGNMDPKGSIPKAILNQGHKIQLKRAQQIIAHLSGLKQ